MKRKMLLEKKLMKVSSLLLAVSMLGGCGSSADDSNANAEASAAEAVVETDSEETTADAENVESKDADLLQTEADDIAEPTPADTTDAASPDALTAAQIRHQYGEVLSQLAETYQLPEGDAVDNPSVSGLEMSDNTYAILDIDGDGLEELTISYSTASMAGMFQAIYGYDPDTQTLTREFMGFPSTELFDNGMLLAYASHNHSRGDFWPLALYQYDPASQKYQQIGYVDTWNKLYGETFLDTETNQELPFPSELDTDDDGILYNIRTENFDDYSYDSYQYNEADYQEWINSYLSDAEPLAPEYLPITPENYQSYLEE